MKRIRLARMVANKTMRVAADVAGTTTRTLSDWEGGASCPSLNQAVALAAFYGCDLNDLVGDVPPGTTIPVELLGRMRTRSAPPADLPRAWEG